MEIQKLYTTHEVSKIIKTIAFAWEKFILNAYVKFYLEIYKYDGYSIKPSRPVTEYDYLETSWISNSVQDHLQVWEFEVSSRN